MASYERLSSLDQTFLSFETSTTHMHIALTAIFEGASLAGRDGGIDIARVRQHVAGRLHLCPRYRQRLAAVPITGDPVWVDDDRFDLHEHVRHASLPHPGNEAQLRRRCEEILERALDRTRPLWEIWIIEGLAGRRFAMLTKAHHCLVDGIGGVEILTTLLSPAPDTTSAAAPPWTPRARPGAGEMLGRELWRRGRALLETGHAATDPAALLAGMRRRTTAVGSLLASGLRPTTRTPLTCTVGTHRRIRWLSFPLGEVKAVKRALGGTVNDVVLATVAGGLRRFLLTRRVGAAAELRDFRVAVPVNCRGIADGRAGNCTSLWLLPLPLADADPRRRLCAVRAATADLKARNGAEGVQVLADAAEWLGARALHVAIRLIAHASPFNLVVTNVPGPAVPLYLLDARMEAAYPYLPLFQHQGLGIALFSYRDRLTWGLTGDRDAVPDLDHLSHALEHAFGELRLAAAAGHARNGEQVPAGAREARTGFVNGSSHPQREGPPGLARRERPFLIPQPEPAPGPHPARAGFATPVARGASGS